MKFPLIPTLAKWVMTGSVAIMVLAFVAVQIDGCRKHAAIRNLGNGLSKTTKVVDDANNQGKAVLDRNSRRDSSVIRLDVDAKAITRHLPSIHHAIAAAADKLPITDADSLRAAVAALDTLLAIKTAQVETLKVENMELTRALVASMAASTQCLSADSTATEMGVDALAALHTARMHQTVITAGAVAGTAVCATTGQNPLVTTGCAVAGAAVGWIYSVFR